MVQEFQRARRPEQKEERRLRLLTVARAALVSGVAIEGLSLSSIARDAGMAKANTYRYFESREALLRDVWEYDNLIDTRTVDTHMRRLREKLGEGAQYLDTVRGVGYRFMEA